METDRNGVKAHTLCFGRTGRQFVIAWAAHRISQRQGHIQYSLSTSRKQPTLFLHLPLYYRPRTSSSIAQSHYKSDSHTSLRCIRVSWPLDLRLPFGSNATTPRQYVISTSAEET